MASESAAAAARSWSQLIMSELGSDYGTAEAAADEAAAADAIAGWAQAQSPLPRAQQAAEPREVERRIEACSAAAQRATGALEALRAESRAADERFGAEKEAFMKIAMEGFVRLRQSFRECQQGRASLRLASRLMEPRIAEAERLGLQLRELAGADGGDQPASQQRQQPSSASKRKRAPEGEEQASGALEQRSANTPRASNSGKRRRRLSPGSSPRSKLRADAGKECSIQ